MKSVNTYLTSDINGKYNIVSLIHYAIWVCLSILVYKYILYPALVRLDQSLFWYDGVRYSCHDFTWIFNYVKSFWLNQRLSNESIYSVENFLYVTRTWMGTEVNSSLAFGYSPTMLLVLAPLAVFTQTVAFCIFNVFGLLAVWWQTRPERCRFGIGLLAFMSPLAFGCFIIGQTALLTGAGLLFLAERSKNGFERGISSQSFFCALVLWALAAKPPLGLTAGVVLLSLRQWQPVLLASFLVLTTTLAISPYLGPGWMNDYLTLIGKYDRVQCNPVFMGGLVPADMANLRGVLSVDFGMLDNIASRVSSVVWIITLVGVVVAGHHLRLTVGGLWSTCLLLYLLFCPHVTSTEVLQLVIIIPLCIPSNALIKLNFKELLLLFFIPLLVYISPISFGSRIILFFGLLCLLVFILFALRKSVYDEDCN